MTLLLRIENYDQLDNGGPTTLTVDGRGISVGRRSSMDWVLPDPSKMISGHHFDVTCEGGQYQLVDCSTNGTFLDGQRHRLEGPLPLRGGERLIVGHYMICVEIQQAAPPPTPPAGLHVPPNQTVTDDPWGNVFSEVSPIARAPAMPTPSASLDALNDGFVPMPSPAAPRADDSGLQRPGFAQAEPEPPAAPQSAAPQWAEPEPEPGIGVPYTPNFGRDPAEDAEEPPAPQPVAQPPAPEMPPYPIAEDVPSHPVTPEDVPPHFAPQTPSEPMAPRAPEPAPQPAPFPVAAPAAHQPAAPAAHPPVAPASPPPTAPAATPAPTAEPSAASGGDLNAALRAFCEGAGLDPKSIRPEEAAGLMHMLGRCVRVATEEQMAMLKARADVKAFTRGGVRTMLSANANNPLKFMPDSQQALELMFVAPRDGFMTGADSFADALMDIRRHQEAVFAALQPALAEVFRGLSPEEVEASTEGTGSNLLGGGKRGAKQWSTYVDRWDQKAQAGDHGILDAFLQAFARAYAEASTRE